MTFDLAQMIADREAGTPGPWRHYLDGFASSSIKANCDPDPESYDGDVILCRVASHSAVSYPQEKANARRIARIPLFEAEIIRLTARVAKLEGALKPLADMAERYDPDDGDDGQLECWSGLAVPKIHHLRTARAALSTHTEEPKT